MPDAMLKLAISPEALLISGCSDGCSGSSPQKPGSSYLSVEPGKAGFPLSRESRKEGPPRPQPSFAISLSTVPVVIGW